MDIRDVEAAVAVSRYGSYFEAAYQINVSRTTLSRRIAHLETELSITLFRRATRSQQVSLTEEGYRLIPLFYNLLENEKNIISLCQELKNNNHMLLNVGYRATFFSEKRKALLSGFCSDFPSFDIISKPEHENELVRMLAADRIDCIIMPVMNVEEDYFRQILTSEKYAWIPVFFYNCLRLGVAADSDLAKKSLIEKSDFPSLADYTFLFDALYTDAHPQVMANFLGIKNMKKRFIDFSTPEIVVNLVKNQGCILPQMVEEDSICGLRFVPVDGSPNTMTTYFIFKRANTSKALRVFTRYVTNRIEG